MSDKGQPARRRAGSAGRKPASEYRAKVADSLVTEARARVTAANRTLLALFLLILWSWASNLSWIDFTGGKTGTYWERIEEAQRATNALTSSCLTPVGQTPLTRPGNPGELKHDCTGKLQDLKANFERLNSDFDLFLI